VKETLQLNTGDEQTTERKQQLTNGNFLEVDPSTSYCSCFVYRVLWRAKTFLYQFSFFHLGCNIIIASIQLTDFTQ